MGLIEIAKQQAALAQNTNPEGREREAIRRGDEGCSATQQLGEFLRRQQPFFAGN